MESVYSTDKNMYWSPAATLEELRKQQKEKSLKSYHPIEPQHVSLSSPLGKGEFGAVYKGVWMSRDGSIEVAVKTLCRECLHQRLAATARAGPQFKHRFFYYGLQRSAFKYKTSYSMHIHENMFGESNRHAG